MEDTIWKVLIADDEPIIREGIRDNVDWKSLNMEVAAEAEDGEEALALALELEIEILLVDLNMPIMNGLSLIKKLKEQQQNCKIVIISGYDDFSYAQEAIRLQVTDYILKPVEPDQLFKVLSTVKEELEESIKRKKYFLVASNHIEKNKNVMLEKFGRDWIEGVLEDEEITKQLTFFDLPNEQPQQVALLQCPEFLVKKPIMNEKEEKEILSIIRSRLEMKLEQYRHMIFQDEEEQFILLLWHQLNEKEWVQIENDLNGYLSAVVQITVESLNAETDTVARAYKVCKDLYNRETSISPIVRRAQQYIQAHYTESKMTLERVANTLNVSPVYLSRVIKQELGVSFVHLVTNLRIKKSVELLQNTELAIVEIAEKVGYETQHYFSTSFKKVIGVSPNKYRKKLQFY
ncbi:response regulator transcription factor [Metabacillus malikii]|uniref:Two-component system response regulator YesN n=1 Tax=Metabacillus malikii TaxID=1504265 RepID=A0ABT9ZAV6_9BACI|nr:response regulator [Metabacillus malikii]MDQ0229379.1 two-component system response regulator YesN [Metabacillus malikii]